MDFMEVSISGIPGNPIPIQANIRVWLRSECGGVDASCTTYHRQWQSGISRRWRWLLFPNYDIGSLFPLLRFYRERTMAVQTAVL